MWVFWMRVYLCIILCNIIKIQKMVSDNLELELQIVIFYSVSGKN